MGNMDQSQGNIRGFGANNIFSALSGQTNGGTNTPNSVVSALPQQGQLPSNMGNPAQGVPFNRFGWGSGGQNPTPNQPSMGSGMSQTQGSGLPGMFGGFLSSLPGLLQSMGGAGGANSPFQGFMNGIAGKIQSNVIPRFGNNA